MKKYKIYGLLIALSTIVVSCFDHEPKVEEFPSPDVAFNYSVIDNNYQLDYYVGATIEFRSLSDAPGECTWDFGDGTTANGNIVTHKYEAAGTYQVKLTVSDKGFLTQSILISDIRPVMTIINPVEGEICEVGTTLVNISVDLPNPEGLSEEYTWIFPEGTLNEAGQEMTTFSGKDPGTLIFSYIGSQTVRLQTRLGGRLLEDGVKKVQVGYTEEVPTLYYAASKGNIMALKLVNNAPESMKINPFDMGVKSGEHPLNILFDDQTLYVLDCGKEFTYYNDVNLNHGDGRIFVMSKDGSEVAVMLTNAGQYNFDDPFYGYIENGQLNFTDRNTGIARIGLGERNRIFNRTDFPYVVENARLGYYNLGLSYGAINACIGKVNGVWYWCKTYNGEGIFRFRDSDILSSPLGSGQTAPLPTAGWVLKSMHPKSFVWDDVRQVFYFSLWDTGVEGVYRCTLDQLEGITSTAGLTPYRLTFANGKNAIPIIKNGVGEGADGEYISICQLALDRSTGAVYFGLRSGDPDTKSGLVRYNPASGRLELVPGTEGVEIYGVAVNNTPSKLF